MAHPSINSATLTVKGAEQAKINTVTMMRTLRALANKANKVLQKEFIKRVQKNISRRDFSKKDLREMGSPYSKIRYTGGINSSVLGGIYIRRNYLVQTRSGRFYNALTTKIDRTNQLIRAYMDYNKGYHVKFIVEGTKIMHGRDVITRTAAETGFITFTRKTAEKYMKQAIKRYPHLER